MWKADAKDPNLHHFTVLGENLFPQELVLGPLLFNRLLPNQRLNLYYNIGDIPYNKSIKEPMKLMKKYRLCFSHAMEFNYEYFDTIRLCSVDSNKFIRYLKLRILLVLFCCYFAILFIVIFITRMKKIRFYLVILLWNMVVRPRNMKVIVALMNIQALSYLDMQGIAMIPMVHLLRVLVTRK